MSTAATPEIPPHDTPLDAQHYAAHDDVSIYGIGLSPEQAVADAVRDIGASEADLSTARISRDLYRLVWESGWLPWEKFMVVDGELIDTTRRRLHADAITTEED